MKAMLLSAAVALLAGCAAAARVATITAPFDEAQAKRLLEPGTNTIRGSALGTARVSAVGYKRGRGYCDPGPCSPRLFRVTILVR